MGIEFKHYIPIIYNEVYMYLSWGCFITNKKGANTGDCISYHPYEIFVLFLHKSLLYDILMYRASDLKPDFL